MQLPDKALFAARWTKTQRAMHAERLDALVVAHPPVLQWLTGYRPPLAVSSARPWFGILPSDSEPLLGVAELAVGDATRLSHAACAFAWPSPGAAEGLPELLANLESIPRRSGRLGVTLGDHSRLGFPARYLEEFTTAGFELVDAAPLLWAQRMVKDQYEVAMIRAATHAAHCGFKAIEQTAVIGKTERELANVFYVAALDANGSDVGYLAVGSGPGGADSGIRSPGGRVLQLGDHLLIDAGMRVDGYWCDFNRSFMVGDSTPTLRHAAEATWRSAREVIASIQPGMTAGSVWTIIAQSLRSSGYDVPSTGRLGHGVGLEFTEPPSIARDDGTILRPGMVITVEPTVLIPRGANVQGIVPYEDVIVITSAGTEHISTPAPEPVFNSRLGTAVNKTSDD